MAERQWETNDAEAETETQAAPRPTESARPVTGADRDAQPAFAASGAGEPPRSPTRVRDALLVVARQAAHEADTDALWALLERETRAIVGADAAVVLRWDAQAGDLVAVGSTLPSFPAGAHLQLGDGALSRAIRQRVPVIENDYQSIRTATGGAQRDGAHAVVAAPILDEGRLLGGLAALSMDAHRGFTDGDAEALDLLAGLVAAALTGVDRARLAGAVLAARTAQHQLNNMLSLTVGYGEMLLRDPTLPPNLRPLLEAAMEGASRACSLVEQLNSITQLTTQASDGPTPVLDLEASTRPRSTHRAS